MERITPDIDPRTSISRRTLLQGVTAIGISEVLAGCSRESEIDMQPLPDCGGTPVRVEAPPLKAEGLNLAAQEWQMPGVEMRDGALRVLPAPVTIVDKNERELAEDPANAKDIPILPFSTERRFQSDSGLQIESSFKLSAANAKASLLLAETLPLIYDEFQFPGKGIRLTVSGHTGAFEVWDGQHQQPQRHEFALDRPGLDKAISVRKEGDSLSIAINGQVVQAVRGFTANKTWLGLEAQDGAYDVTAFNVAPLPGKAAAVANMRTLKVDACSDGLRPLAERKNPRCKIGTAVAVAPMLDNEKYAALLAGNFNIITTENALKPQFIQPQEGVFRTEEMQRIIAFAEQHGMQLHGHALLPNRSLPKWMRDPPTNTPAKKMRVRQVMVDHITGVLKRFPTLVSVDVINEALDGRDWRKNSLWYRAMGDEFIDIALQAAYDATRENNPNIILVVNDNATDKADNRDEARFELLRKKLVTVQAKIPGIRLAMGFEGHVKKLSQDEMSPEHLGRRMAILAQDDLYARVSEMDVTTHQGGDTTPEGLRIQAEQFGSIAKTCIDASNCIAFVTWGIGGKYVSTAGVNDKGELSVGSNLPWDRNLSQRPLAYRALQAALQ